MARQRLSAPFALALAAIVLLGAGLRFEFAHGALWLDEAWSAVFARDVATPAGVFLHINHDNNHHLSTLWLQFVGFDAPPVVQRALSITTGTLGVALIGMIGARRGPVAGLVAALMLALAPLPLTLGSEARGYAPMILALLVAIAMTDTALARPDRPAPAIGLAIVCLIGMAAQMTIAVGILAIAVRIAGDRLRTDGFRPAAMRAATFAGPALLVSAAFALFVLVIAPGPAGFQFGNYDPFSWQGLADGYGSALAATFGSGMAASVAIPAVALGLVVTRGAGIGSRGWFYAAALIGFPVGLAVLHAGNVGFTRYYVVPSLAAILLAADVAQAAVERGRLFRVITALVALICLAATIPRDLTDIANHRGDPGRAIEAMQRLAPYGGAVAIERSRARAVLESAAAAHRYPLHIADCAPFLYVDRDGVQPFPTAPARCGRPYHLVIEGRTTGLSGNHWRLYRR